MLFFDRLGEDRGDNLLKPIVSVGLDVLDELLGELRLLLWGDLVQD